MQAREIMTENPICCLPTDTLVTVAQRMRDHGFGLLPVVESFDSNRLIGVISDRDIICRVVASGGNYATAAVQSAMTSGRLWTVQPGSSIDDVLEQMEEGQVRRIPVVDEQFRVHGIIATADIALELDEPEDIAEVLEEISEPSRQAP